MFDFVAQVSTHPRPAARGAAGQGALGSVIATPRPPRHVQATSIPFGLPWRQPTNPLLKVADRPKRWSSSSDQRSPCGTVRSGLEPADLTLYSTRHLMADWLDSAGIAQQPRDRILGHASAWALWTRAFSTPKSLLARNLADAGALRVLETY